MREKMKHLLVGAVDMHVHAGPAVRPRSRDMMEVMMDAREAGMRAVVFKDHNSITADRAYFVNKVVTGVKAFGGIVLDYAVGGLNPKAVESAIKLGAKVVYMPTLDSSWSIRRVHVTKEAARAARLVTLKEPKEGLSILKGGLEGNEILPVVEEVVELIAKANIILDTSHLSPRESLILIDEAKKVGVKKMVINHPNSVFIRTSIEEQREMARKGAYLNYVFHECMPMGSREDPAEIAEMIKSVGAEHCLMSTDFGNVASPPPIVGMQMFILSMLAKGISEEEVEIMIKKNPAELLDLS